MGGHTNKTAADRCQVYPRLVDVDRHRALRLFIPVKRSGKDIPWGYHQRDDDSGMLDPDEDALKWLLEAIKHLETSTYKDISEWLTAKTGRYISPFGFQKLIEGRMPFKECKYPLKKRMTL